MSITITVVGGVSRVQVVAPTTPRHHTSLLTQTRTLLQHHLPMLGTWGVGPFNIQLLVNTIIAGQQQSQQEQAQAHAEQQQKESDTIERLLGPRNFSPLLQYCGAPGKANLPPLWSALVKADSKDHLDIFQGKIADKFITMGADYKQYRAQYLLAHQGHYPTISHDEP